MKVRMTESEYKKYLNYRKKQIRESFEDEEDDELGLWNPTCIVGATLLTKTEAERAIDNYFDDYPEFFGDYYSAWWTSTKVPYSEVDVDDLNPDIKYSNS